LDAFSLADHPHRRFNPLTQEWVLCSPHRAKRPWQGKREAPPPTDRPAHDPKCYLCPGNLRANGERNPQYEGTHVFDNDFATMLADTPEGESAASDLLRAESERGWCRVICFSPRHDLSLAEMPAAGIRRVVDVWCEQFELVGAKSFVNYVQMFENKGDLMGCSNPHPHGQLWANQNLPTEPAKEQAGLLAYIERKSHCLLCDYGELERRRGERLVCANDYFTAVVPFWAVWPFETLIVGRRHVSSLPELVAEERDALADLIRRLTARYDNLFGVSFPYSMGWHQRPTDGQPHAEWHVHCHFYPPLLRSAAVKKFMVGYEMLGMPQRDLTAETAAERLRKLCSVHHKQSRTTAAKFCCCQSAARKSG